MATVFGDKVHYCKVAQPAACLDLQVLRAGEARKKGDERAHAVAAEFVYVLACGTKPARMAVP